MTKKSSPKKQPLMLHSLLGALSFWGTATRMFLFSILAVAVFLVALTETATSRGVDMEVMLLIYVLGSFVVLDFGYVMIARAYTLPKALDALVLCAADIVLGLLYIAPKVVVSPGVNLGTHPLLYVMFIPIIVLSLRMLLGILSGGRPK